MANLRANRITSTEVFETTGSVQFDGVNGTNLQISNSTDIQLGSGTNWTIEFWALRPDAFVDYDVIIGKGNGSGTYEWFVEGFADGAVDILYSANGTTTWTGQHEILSSMNLNQWYHFALVRNGTSFKAYIDGIETFSTAGFNIYAGTGDLHIGGYGGAAAQDPPIFISNVRIVNGVSIYTENFTPPTRELEVIPNTVLLACQSTTKADEEKTGKTITVNGNAVANELTPGLLTSVVKSGGSSAITGSVEFDGSGDYLSVTPTDDFELGSDDFTIEAWVYSRNWKAAFANMIFSKGNSSSTSTEYYSLQATQTAGRVQFFWRSGSALLDGSNTRNLSTDSWNHVAVTRSGDTFSLYINGILDDTATSSTTLTTGVTGGVLIGGQSYDPTNNDRVLTGNISNLRVIKGTALYTQDFIPPTRKLTNLPGTVLLCCQDSNDPTTEATGKTITGHGDLSREDVGVELVANGNNWTGATGTTPPNSWYTSGSTSTYTISSGQLVYDRNGEATGEDAKFKQDLTTKVGSTYLLTVNLIARTIGGLILDVGSNINVFSSTTVTEIKTYIFVASSTTTTIAMRNSSTTGTLTIDDVSVTKLDPGNRASDFTPSVGSDDSVEFAGPITINTENYFYLPTGPTEQRGRGRGLFGGGDPGINTINYITIASMGNAQDFGDLSQTRLGPGSVASSTRAVFMTGYSGGNVDTMDFVTIATTGNAVDFGNLAGDDRHESAGVSNQTRGMVGGGQGSAISDRIDYITIASTGDSIDFGNLTLARRNATGVMSPTRGVFCGGRDNTPAPSTQQEEMDYVTIASTGNAINFGDLTVARGRMGSVCSSVRGVVGGGEGSPADSNVIDYITIASTGNAQDFGDMITASEGASGGCSNSMRGVFGGHDVPGGVNTMEYVTISSTGNSQDFGDLLNTAQRRSGCSDSHGGLG